MRNMLKWVVAVLAVMCAVACGGMRPERSETAMKAFVEGGATIRGRWPWEWGFWPGWLAFGTGMEVAAGDRMHVGGEGLSYIELRDSRSRVILGPQSMAVLERVSTDPRVTQTRLRLEDSGMYAAIDETTGEGYLEVETPAGTVGLVQMAGGSAMMVAAEAGAGVTRIACIRGRVTVHAGGKSTILSVGTSLTFARKEGTQLIQAFEGQPPGTDPLLWQVVLGARDP
jgi:hypothetical protein